MDLFDDFRSLMERSLQLVLQQDRFPNMEADVMNLYYEIVGVRNWYNHSDVRVTRETTLQTYFESRYAALSARLRVFMHLFEFEIIQVDRSVAIAC